jgi:hypothetical protein
MVILALSVYGIGKILYTRNAGLVAGFLVSCYPIIGNYVARIYYQRHAASHDRLSLLSFSKIRKFRPVQPLIASIQNMI